MKTRILVISFVLSALASASAFSCGDSLYRVGKGVSYRVYSAPIPGNLLVFAPTEGAKQLAEQLAKSGHGVQMVSDMDELQAELQRGGYDVVIAPYSERSVIESKTASGSNAEFLPIVFNSEEERAAKQSYDRVMVPEKHEIKHYLKAIHVALKKKA
jgi:hypothetical protein